MFMKDAGHMLGSMWLEEEENHTPVPQFEARVRKLFMLDIATVNPLLFYKTF